MAIAETPTLLSIDRYARIMGIDPVHFNGAVGVALFPMRGGCPDVWWQRSYIGSDRVSREDLALAIADAEADIASFLGYWPAPMWFEREMHRWPAIYRHTHFGTGADVRWDDKGIKLRWGRFITAGRRYTQLIGQATEAGLTLDWSDPDGDGFDERATITLPNILALTNLSRQQVKCYFDGHDEREWEIRNPRTVEITAVSVIITFDFWQLIDPALQDTYPDGNPEALNIVDAIYVDTVDVYREYTDFSQHSAEFFWEPRYTGPACPNCGGAGCTVCQHSVQCGCLHVRDVNLGIAVASPGEWSATEAAWQNQTWDLCYDPDIVKVWYYAGEVSDRFLAGDSLDPLGNTLAEAIAYMATARLERNFCACGNLTALATDLRRDLSRSDPDGPTFMLSTLEQNCPFGTRKGEVMAWRRLAHSTERIGKVAVL